MTQKIGGNREGFRASHQERRLLLWTSRVYDWNQNTFRNLSNESTSTWFVDWRTNPYKSFLVWTRSKSTRNGHVSKFLIMLVDLFCCKIKNRFSPNLLFPFLIITRWIVSLVSTISTTWFCFALLCFACFQNCFVKIVQQVVSFFLSKSSRDWVFSFKTAVK